MFTRRRFGTVFAVGLLLVACSSIVIAQEREGISNAALAELTNRAMSEFSVPGMAGGVICSRFVIRSVDRSLEADADVLFDRGQT